MMIMMAAAAERRAIVCTVKHSYSRVAYLALHHRAGLTDTQPTVHVHAILTRSTTPCSRLSAVLAVTQLDALLYT